MRAEFFMSALLLTTCANALNAQDALGTVSSGVGIATGGLTNNAVASARSEGDDWPSLSNRTVRLISIARGVPPEAVVIKSSYAPAIGPYEIDLTSAKDFFAEAEALSRELGTRFTVVADAASDDGTVRTNRTFRDGVMRPMILRVEGTPMPTAQRKLYVRPHGAGGLSPPTAARIAQ